MAALKETSDVNDREPPGHPWRASNRHARPKDLQTLEGALSTSTFRSAGTAFLSHDVPDTPAVGTGLWVEDGSLF
ncbi:hypothetical protein HIM_01916 [Hirsutella minnesotensis 3608]|nr:hypothetical protein HIM_01916 [Hirsutella minnesotensis 3608]